MEKPAALPAERLGSLLRVRSLSSPGPRMVSCFLGCQMGNATGHEVMKLKVRFAWHGADMLQHDVLSCYVDGYHVI